MDSKPYSLNSYESKIIDSLRNFTKGYDYVIAPIGEELSSVPNERRMHITVIRRQNKFAVGDKFKIRDCEDIFQIIELNGQFYSLNIATSKVDIPDGKDTIQQLMEVYQFMSPRRVDYQPQTIEG